MRVFITSILFIALFASNPVSKAFCCESNTEVPLEDVSLSSEELDALTTIELLENLLKEN